MVYQFSFSEVETIQTARRLPRSVQISEALIREISAGILQDGTRLPTEKKMAEQYQVAVGTLRKSLAILESKGLIERVQGSGNYVRFKQNVESVYTHFRLELLDGGGLPMAKTHSIDLMAKEAGFPDFGTSKKAHRIVRLRYLNDVLVALEQIWLDERFTQELIAGDASESLYDFYKTRLNLVISQIEDKISVQSVPDWSPAEFNMPVGALAGYIERIGYDQFDLPAEFSKTWFNPDVCHYVNRA